MLISPDLARILQMLTAEIKPSIPEICQELNLKSTRQGHIKLQKLVEGGFVKPPPKPGMARAYTLTSKGYDYLKRAGLWM